MPENKAVEESRNLSSAIAERIGHPPEDVAHAPRVSSLSGFATPPHGVPPLMRVVRFGDKAWTMDCVRNAGEITEAGVTISWTSDQASALDQSTVADGRDVGTISARDASGKDVAHDLVFAFHALWPDGEWMWGADPTPRRIFDILRPAAAHLSVRTLGGCGRTPPQHEDGAAPGYPSASDLPKPRLPEAIA